MQKIDCVKYKRRDLVEQSEWKEWFPYESCEFEINDDTIIYQDYWEKKHNNRVVFKITETQQVSENHVIYKLIDDFNMEYQLEYMIIDKNSFVVYLRNNNIEFKYF